MKVLWLCNNPTPEIAELFALPNAKPESWITAYLEEIKKTNIVLFYVFRSKVKIKEQIGNITYYSYPDKNIERYSKKLKESFQSLIDELCPDIIHIWGTEYPRTYSMIETCYHNFSLNRVIISIQGLVSEIEKDYYNGIKFPFMLFATPRDVVRFDNIFFQRAKFKRRGKFEKKSLQLAKRIIGRTDWDKFKSLKYSEDMVYYCCNEILRPRFYSSRKWTYNECQKHSIFVSQSNYPLKGFHYVLKAFAKVLKKFPDAHLYTTGPSPFLKNRLQRMLHQGSYNKYIGRIIKKEKIQNHVTFLGDLCEEQMVAQYLKSNLFVSASSLENSSNSTCEAQLLGVPIISTFVGGMSNLLNHNYDSFMYENNDIDMLAGYIITLFNDVDLCKAFTKRGLENATLRHAKNTNVSKLLKIYEECYDDE